MAKPVDNGILYFPFPVDFFHDPKVKRLERKFPGSGIRLYLKIRCDGHARHGYYFPLDEDSIFNILDDLRMDEDEFDEMVEFMVEKKILVEVNHSTLGRVVTSKDMQRDFQVAVSERVKKRRQRDDTYCLRVDGLIWILDETETDDRICPVSVPGQSRDDVGNVCDRPDNRRVKESIKEDGKEEDTTGKETRTEERTADDSDKEPLSQSGIPSIDLIRDFISEKYPELDAEQTAAKTAALMVLHEKEEQEPIRVWRSFTIRVCMNEMESRT